MSENPKRPASLVGDEAYENDFRPGGSDQPSPAFLANMPPEVRRLYDERVAAAKAEGSGQATA